MFGGDLGVTRFVRGVLGNDDDVAGPRGEAAESGIGIERGRVEFGNLWHKAFLGSLFGDAHGLADVGPRGARSPGLVDEMPDEVVGDLADGVGGDDGIDFLDAEMLVKLIAAAPAATYLTLAMTDDTMSITPVYR